MIADWQEIARKLGDDYRALLAERDEARKLLDFVKKSGWLCVVVNDFFAPAADSEDIESLDELKAACDAVERFGHDGLYAWVSIKRGNAEPWERVKARGNLAGFYAARTALSGSQGAT